MKFSAAAIRLATCVWARVEKQQPVDAELFNFARTLIHATVEKPISGYTLQAQFRTSEREIKDFVRTLRREWELPIGSLRKPPYGYFWISTTKDFLDWSRVYRAQAIDELVTLYRIERRNFPEVSGQEAFAFMQTVQREMEEALR